MTRPPFSGDGFFRCPCGARIATPNVLGDWVCPDCTPSTPGLHLPFPGRITNWAAIREAMADAEEWAEQEADEAKEAIEDSIWESHRIIIELEG